MHKRRDWHVYRASLVTGDAIMLGLAFVLAAWFRSSFAVLTYRPQFDVQAYGLVALAIIPGLVLILWLRGAYTAHHLLGGPDEYAHIVNGCTYGSLLVLAASYLYDTAPTVSRGWLLLFWALAIILVGAGRFTLRRIAYQLRRRGWFVRRVLIAGASDQGLSIAHQLHSPGGQGAEVVGFLDDYMPTGARIGTYTPDQAPAADAPRFRILGHPRDASSLAAAYQCDLLIVVQAALTWESHQRLTQLAAIRTDGPEIRLAPTLYDLTAAGVEAAPLGYIPMVRLQTARLVGADAILRASVDIGLALGLLIILAPVFAGLVLRGWQCGCRPVLTRRQIVGQGGRPVTFSVFHPAVTQRLVFRGLPALVAVLRGDLGVVGPRPIAIHEQPEYQPWLGILSAVRPGLTGPWRLSSASTSSEERVKADVWWIRNWTIWRHLFVVFQTGVRVLTRGPNEPHLERWDAPYRAWQYGLPSHDHGLAPLASKVR